MTFLSSILAQNPAIGIFQNHRDIGKPALAGSVDYDENEQQYTLKGAGYNIGSERDEFHYAYNAISGDFILTAEFAFAGEGVNPHRKVGWMVRESVDDNASHVSAVLHGDGLTVLQWRELKGAFMRDPEDQIFTPKNHYTILQLERKGQEFIFRAAHPGEPLQWIGSKTMPHMPKEALAGLFICSHNPEAMEAAWAWNVRIDKPLPEDYSAYQDGQKGSRLEIMNVETGERKVIFERATGFEAPNWMPDGQHLLFNMDGGIYKIPISGGTPEKLDTGEAQRNNNDHGISFDGKMLAISSHREGMPGGGSTVYVLPLKGGKPKLVTEKTPSYWHGWTPDNQAVLYVAQREGSEQYNLYQKPIQGGEEVALTNIGPGEHVDGPEYSPDGQFIYYNGNHTGTMQLWRMQPDGSNREQLTFDQYNDWFPHLSPDGKQILFISFPSTIPVNSHPFYQRVMLRLMPVSGGAPRVVAHLYGGQGTINVPSWSPDSKWVAFVSNFGRE
jgi:TolB protein